MSNSHQVVKKKCEEKESVTKFSVMSSTSVANIAETIGFKNLNEEILELISEDVTYKLRELLHCCSVHTRHVKQCALSTRTVDSVLRITSLPFVDGHKHHGPLEFMKVEDCDVFVENNVEIDLADLALSNNEKCVQTPDVEVHSEVLYPHVIEEKLDSINNLNVAQPYFEVTFESAENSKKSLEQKIKIVEDGLHIKKKPPRKEIKSENGEIRVKKENKLKEEESGDRKSKKEKKQKDKVDDKIIKEDKGDRERKHEKEEKAKKENHKKETKAKREVESGQQKKDKKSSKEDSHGKHKKEEKKNNIEVRNVKHKKDDDKRSNVEINDIKHKKEEKRSSIEISEPKQRKEARSNKVEDVFVKPRDVESKSSKRENIKKHKKEENMRNDSCKKDKKHDGKTDKEEKVVKTEHTDMVKHQHKKIKKEKDSEYNENEKLIETMKLPAMMLHNAIYPQIPSYLKTYYQRFCKGIFMDSSVVFGVILRHLKSSSKIKVLAPFFLNFTCATFTTVRWGCHLSQKIVRVIDAIASNKHVYVEGTAVTHRVVSVLLNAVVLVEDESTTGYEFRKLIGAVVGKVLNEWCREDEAIQTRVEKLALTVLNNNKYSAQSYYGVISILLSLGSNALDYAFWPYFMTIQTLLVKNTWYSLEILEVENLILMVLHSFFRRSWDLGMYKEPSKDLFRFVSEYFGERLAVVEAYGLLPCTITACTNQSASSELTALFDINGIDQPRHISLLRELPIPVINCDAKQNINEIFETVTLKKKVQFKFKIKWTEVTKKDTDVVKEEAVHSNWLADNNMKAVHKILVGHRRRHLYSKSFIRPRKHFVINYNPSNMLICHVV